FVGIDSRDAGTSQAKAYNERFGIGWPSFFSPGGEALLAFPGVLTPNSVPATVVLDAQGRAAADINGGVPSTLTLVPLVEDVVRNGWLVPAAGVVRLAAPGDPGRADRGARLVLLPLRDPAPAGLPL